MKEGNKVISAQDDSQKETEARVRGRWSSDLRQHFKMGRKPSSQPVSARAEDSLPDSKQQTETLVTARVRHVPETGREAARVPCASWPPSVVPPLLESSLQLQGIPMLLLGRLEATKLDSWLDAPSTAWRAQNHCNG